MNLNDIKTPAYVIDEKKLRENLEILDRVQKESGAKILLAQKAYSVYQTYPLIAKYLTGATASGLYEARLAHEEMKLENHVYEPAFEDEEMGELCNICDHIVFNSLNQLEHHRPTWEQAAKEGKISVGLRINPEYSTQEEHEIYDPCADGSRLGIKLANMPDDLPEGVEGLHFHTLCEQGFEPLLDTFLFVEDKFSGYFPNPVSEVNIGDYGYAMMHRAGFDRIRENISSNVSASIGGAINTDDYKSINENIYKTGEVSLEHTTNTDTASMEPNANADEENKSRTRIKWINLGGGHHITREDYDVKGLIGLVKYIKDKYGIDVYLEPGEAIALDAGYLVTTVMDIVPTQRMPVLILDTSAACHMPDVLEMPYRPPLRDSEEPGELPYNYRLSSRTCLAGDIIGDYSFEHEIFIGDRLFFEDMAIYSIVKNNTFNGMPLPDIDILHENGEVEVIRKFGYEDFKMRL
ncbi:carboxynorspermidine decarboxylase [Butyrivibrio sp. VCB2006]|uniref:carboxynorspermidine decarboxylase n=1 Tax=Butyrivibrio sp. VCB2006 TaxID=1280679 RepID=UPI0004078B87|nr:carboxynorspermidine decarboxylase [Butyrivibrio sp. VCB2006]